MKEFIFTFKIAYKKKKKKKKNNKVKINYIVDVNKLICLERNTKENSKR